MFGAVSLTKHVDTDQYRYLDVVLDLIEKESFHLVMDLVETIIFGADMSSSVHANNRKSNIIVLGKDFTQGLSNTIYVEKLYSINFTKTNTKFYLSLHYNRSNSYLFVIGTEIHKFKAKDSEIVATSLCLGNISKDFSVVNMKKAGFNGYV